MNRPDLVKTLVAEAAISAHRIVKFGADVDHALQASAATDAMFGVAAELDHEANERIDVILTGAATVEYGASVTRGDLLTSDANGKAVPVTRHTHTENTESSYTQNTTTDPASGERIIGVALVDGVDGDYGSVAIHPAFA